MIDDQQDDFASDPYVAPLLARRLWDAMYFESGIEGQCDDALIKTFEADPEKPGEWPFLGITYDPYDGSFELKGIADGAWVPTMGQMAEVWRLGFDRCWLCYENGMERYCDPAYGIGDLKPDIAAEMAVKALGKTKGKEPVNAKRETVNEAGSGSPDRPQKEGRTDLVAKELWRRIWGRFFGSPYP